MFRLFDHVAAEVLRLEQVSRFDDFISVFRNLQSNATSPVVN